MSEKASVISALLVGVTGLLLLVVLAFYVGRGCAPTPPAPITTDIDAGPGERAIAARLDAAAQQARADLDRIEHEHANAIAAFDEAQRVKYETVREGGPEAADAFIRDFNRRLRDAGRR